VTPRRRVRVSESFFEQVDRWFPAERRPDGGPSAADFVVVELPAIVEVFALQFDELLVLDEAIPSVRTLVGTGLLVSAFAAHGVLLTDGAVELIGLTVERHDH
jgi:hypothetical protein